MNINEDIYAKVPALQAHAFGIHLITGYLRAKDKHTVADLEQCPVSEKRPELIAWENFAKELSDHYEGGTVSAQLDKIPRFPAEVLFWGTSADSNHPMEPFRKRAFQILTFIASALIHPYGRSVEESGSFIPDNLAEPLLFMANRMGRKPMMSYDEYCLNNCIVHDTFPSPGDFNKLGIINFVLRQKFVRSPNERGFIVPHQGMEYRASPILNTTGMIQLNVLRKDNVSLKSFLWLCAGALRDMASQQSLMWQTCDPEKYVTEVRPQIQYFKDVQFGFQGPKLELRGETGAQSVVFMVLDALLGVEQENNDMKAYLADMRNYIPRQQRDFLTAVESGPSLRARVLECQESDTELVDAYNDCVSGLVLLSENHFRFMAYIGKAKHAIGTGGTPIYSFLPSLIKSRKACLIKTDKTFIA